MNFFNFFRKPIDEPGGGNGLTPKDAVEEPVVDRTLFVKDNNVNQESLVASYEKRIFQYINSDFEVRGYHDALTNPDTKYKEDNIQILKFDLVLLLRESENAYKQYLNEIDFHVASRTKAGLHDLVEELQSKRQLTNDKMLFVQELKTEIESQTGSAQRIVLSYQRGFTRGLAALTSANIINRSI